ncbi:DUF4012 domain-containing protein [Pseudarthrobacter sp. WHRI 8279]|uniref:DUF4012 domain-containing protein n=1 Tax=Pseudarthrobacter sp. WHRI 8279 TaxID=3162566 RepID=UPI0035A983BD
MAGELRLHTSAAKEAAEDPVWVLASSLPVAGPNFSAVSEVSRTADDVATLGLAPLVGVFSALDWDELLPSSSGADLRSLESAAPAVTSAAQAVRLSAERLQQIDDTQLLPQIADPLNRARGELLDVTETLNAASHASETLPAMLGSNEPRNYLLIIQNNAESRTSGGIPGALAILSVDGGRMTLGSQSSASELGVLSPPLPVDPAQQQIYSARLGKFMQDVNLTPDFPTAASTAQAMWERKTGDRVDGVVSIDPVALSYIMAGTGSISLSTQELSALEVSGLPTELTSSNVVTTLLSDVYAEIEQPNLQDIYFAGVAKEVFAKLSSGGADPQKLLDGIGKGISEGRVLVWSNRSEEQSVINRYPLSGSVAGPSVSPAQFGVYFNDGTGAKMDYYVKRSVQLVKECPRDGYEQTTVRITNTNTAPADAATSLPAYVTGGGIYGVPPGSVQTNIVAYGPVQSNVEMAKVDGQKTEFAPHLHGTRPVGVLAIRLSPGESKTVEFTFGKIVQHTEPNVVVTPTVQDVKDVTLPTENAPCH